MALCGSATSGSIRVVCPFLMFSAVDTKSVAIVPFRSKYINVDLKACDLLQLHVHYTAA